MTSYGESVLLAAIAVILVSVPAASQNVEISDEGEGVGIIDSRFSDRFEVDFNPGEEVTTILDSESKLRVNKSFDRNVKELQTAEGSVRVVKTNDSIDKVVQTPYGRFEFGVENGEEYSRFEGERKDDAEQIKSRLMDLLEERSASAEEKRSVVVQEMLPDMSISVEGDPDVEHFNLTNNGDESVDMSAWKVVTEGSGKDYLNLTREIDSGETITYYSGSEEKDFGESTVLTELTVYSGGKITVYNQVEKVIASEDDY